MELSSGQEDVRSAKRRLLPSSLCFYISHVWFLPLFPVYFGLPTSEMPSHATKTAEETSGANKEAFAGAVAGAAKVSHTQHPNPPARFRYRVLCSIAQPLYSISIRALLDTLILIHVPQWGLIAGGLGFVGFYLSPIYRNLTIQFKVYVRLLFPVLSCKSSLPISLLQI